MTLVEFISLTCKEVLDECIPNFQESSKPLTNNSSGSKSLLITESKLKQMIKDGSVNNISANSRFTPLAQDTYKEYMKNKKGR